MHAGIQRDGRRHLLRKFLDILAQMCIHALRLMYRHVLVYGHACGRCGDVCGPEFRRVHSCIDVGIDTSMGMCMHMCVCMDI